MAAPAPPAEERFKANSFVLANLIADGIQELNDRGYNIVNIQIVNMVKIVIENMTAVALIDAFILGSHEECWGKIHEKDEPFFVENANKIFQYLPQDKVNLFKVLFETKDENGKAVIKDETKEDLWDLFGACIKTSIKYIHEGRKPYSMNEAGELVNKYNKEDFYPEVDVKAHAEKWKVKLIFPPKL